MRWGDKRYHTLNYHNRQLFNEKVFKVSLDAGYSCPNRDGKLGVGGCIYCSELGSGDYAGRREHSLTEQFISVRDKMHEKWPNALYIAYFQAYTNTYGPLEQLRANYYLLLEQGGVVGLSISTRPDCLPPEVLDLLSELNKKTKLTVELGLQSMHDRTLALINRGHDYQSFLMAVTDLNRRQIDIVPHIILNLPGETREDMLATVSALAQLPIQGIKVHMLHLLANTPLVQLYEQGELKFMNRNQYVELVADILEILPPELVIHRLTGDGPLKLLIEPRWTIKKWEVLNAIDDELARRDSWQGKKFNFCASPEK
jgi:radical SAM protein (TIGR01212 family)